MSHLELELDALRAAGKELVASDLVEQVIATFESLNAPVSHLQAVQDELCRSSQLSDEDVHYFVRQVETEGFESLDVFEFAQRSGVSEHVVGNARARLEQPAPSFVTSGTEDFFGDDSVGGGGVPREHRRFAVSLVHQLPVVSQQVEAGLYSVKRVAAYLKKLCSFEETYSKELLKSTTHEMTKLDRVQGDGMKRFVQTWISMQEVLFQVAMQHQDFRGKVMSAVVQPLNAFHKEAEANRKAVIAEITTLSKQMRKTGAQLSKARKKCMATLTALKESQDRDRGVTAAPAAGGVFSKLTKRIKEATADSTENLQKKAADACDAYETVLAASNAQRQKFREEDMPLLFERLNQIEVARLDVLKEHMTKFALILHELVAPLEELSTRVVQNVAAMDTDDDVDHFVEGWLEMHGEPQPFEADEYDLPTTPDELRRGAWDGSLERVINHNSLFGATLDKVMELQSESHPDADMPVILTTLIEAIRRNGGTTAEGIFRISASRARLEELKLAFDEGNYAVESKSPHLPAGLLKEWMRNLKEPLIPDALYDVCIDTAKAEEVSTESVLAIWQQVPELNRRMTDKLVHELLREIIANEEQTLMSSANLAIVFAPSFLRCSSDDPLEMMLNSKFETIFVKVLLEGLLAQ